MIAALGLFILIIGGMAFMPFPFCGGIVMLLGLRIMWIGRNSEAMELAMFYGSIASIVLLCLGG